MRSAQEDCVVKERSKQASPIKASFWYTACSIAQKGISMVLVPIYVRLMTTEEYGYYTLFQSWMGIVLIFSTLNLASYAFNNCLIKYEDKKNKVAGAFLGLVSILSFITALVFLLFLPQWEKVFGFSGKYIMALVADSFTTVAIDLWYAKEKFDYKYKGVVFVTLIISVLNLGIGLIAVNMASDKAFAAIIVKITIQGMVTLVLAISVWGISKTFYAKNLWKYALFFNIPLIPHFLSTKVLQQADRIMIQQYCGIAEAGIYGFTGKISDAMMIFNSTFLASVIPWTYKKLKSERYDDIFYNTFITCLLIGVLNLSLILLAPEAVAILGTEEYYEAIYVIPPLACSGYLMYLYNVFVTVTYYYGKNKFVSLASVIAAVINIALNAIFIPQFGYLAAGYTTLASYISLAVIHFIAYRYVLKMEHISYRIYNGHKILLASVFIVGIGCGSILLYPYRWLRFVIVGAAIMFAFIKRDRIIAIIKNK